MQLYYLLFVPTYHVIEANYWSIIFVEIITILFTQLLHLFIESIKLIVEMVILHL